MYIYVPHSNTMKKYEKHTQNSNTVQPIRLYQSFKRKKNINSPIKKKNSKMVFNSHQWLDTSRQP